jgi:hypothetical protein
MYDNKKMSEWMNEWIDNSHSTLESYLNWY